jgi:4-amino-4-deoxy-L-arabinose transferase-like glycosyltransferase
LALHALLLALSIPRNAVTISEFMHVPAGVANWETGEFWGYHHNPPFPRLVFSVPALLWPVVTNYEGYHYVPHWRVPDVRLGVAFMKLNEHDYLAVYGVCRVVVALFSVVGGYAIYRWSCDLFGRTGGLISLSLWATCPLALAHGGLTTPDMVATVLGFSATYQFWRYLRNPSLRSAVPASILLGLALGSKFTMLVLPVVWFLLAAVRCSPTGRRAFAQFKGVAAAQLGILVVVPIVVVNSLYLFEGTGALLGSYRFYSRSLAGKLESPMSNGGNRFAHSILQYLPVPLPEQYLLGLDDQLCDAEDGETYNYLRGEIRKGKGWWYYYVYGLTVKLPMETLFLVGCALLSVIARFCRMHLLNEAALCLPTATILLLISSKSGLNGHVRYALPVLPFLFVFCGRLAKLVTVRPRLWGGVVALALSGNLMSVVSVHPDYLSYFNEAVGGPDDGWKCLAESNLDWGQGLIALREWLDDHRDDRPLYLAYNGTMYPEIVGITYRQPPYGVESIPETLLTSLDPRAVGPVPGLHAVSANLVIGLPFVVPDERHLYYLQCPLNAYRYFQHFTPIARVGHSIYVYDLSLDDVNAVRRRLGLPPL